MSIRSVHSANDGGTYYVTRSIESRESDMCGWLGFNLRNGWSNVFLGRAVRRGQTVLGMSGDWCDVPWGSFLGSGQIGVDFRSAPSGGTTFWRNSVTGGFGGSVWGPALLNHPVFPQLPRGNRNFPEHLLSGVWHTDTGAYYYIRELPSGQIFWFAIRLEGPTPRGPRVEAAHVAKGTRQGSTINVYWLDVLPGAATGEGRLTLRLLTPHFMEKQSSSAAFGSSRWIRLAP